MTRKGRQPATPRISDEDLLDLIEGRLPLERIQELEPALRADPDLYAKVKAMARDRELLEATAGETYSAPSGVMAGALERAEREALAEVASGGAPTGPTMPKLLGTIAAGLVIALSVAFIAKVVLFDDAVGGGAGGIERYVQTEKTERDAEPALAQSQPGNGDTSVTGAGASLAMAGDAMDEASDPKGGRSSAEPTADQDVELGALSEASLAEATALMKEGRLRLVVSGGEAGTRTRLFADLGTVRASDGAFMTPDHALASSLGRVSEEGGASSVRYAERLGAGTYGVRAEMGDGATLTRIVRELESRGVTVRVERAEEAITPEIRVEDVLWWSPRRVEIPPARHAFRVIVE